MKKLIAITWIFFLQIPLSAVAVDSSTNTSAKIDVPSAKACPELSPEDSTKLGFIQQMLTEGKPHAALAHLEATRLKTPPAEILRANALRQTGRTQQAKDIYESLTNSCMSGFAYRGLGLVASVNGNTQDAIKYLEAARNILPTEHTIRNDLGFVLMEHGHYELALHEFLTALELVTDYRQAANNLILLLYKQGETTRAEAFAKQFGIVTEEMQKLKKMTQASAMEQHHEN